MNDKNANDKNMHISVDLIRAAEISWLPQQKKETLKFESFIKRRMRRSIDLSGNSTQDEIDSLIRALIGYNADDVGVKAEKDAEILQLCMRMEQQGMVLPGGIHFKGAGKDIYCGCCSGLEDWFETVKGLKKHVSPWMGHDPDVSFREENGICYIADVDLKPQKILVNGYTEEGRRKYIERQIDLEEVVQDKGRTVIAYQPEEFHACLKRLDGDFLDFVAGPLKKRMEGLVPEYAERFCEAFIICFRREVE